MELGHQPTLDVLNLRGILGDVRGKNLRQSRVGGRVLRFQRLERRPRALQRRLPARVRHLQHLPPAPVQDVLEQVTGVGARRGEPVQTRAAAVRHVQLRDGHPRRERLGERRRLRQVPVSQVIPSRGDEVDHVAPVRRHRLDQKLPRHRRLRRRDFLPVAKHGRPIDAVGVQVIERVAEAFPGGELEDVPTLVRGVPPVLATLRLARHVREDDVDRIRAPGDFIRSLRRRR